MSVRTSRTTGLVTAREGRREVSRGHSSRQDKSVGEGPNLLVQGAVCETRWAWSDSKARDTRRIACATRQAAMAEPELRGSRSHKRPRRQNGNDPWRGSLVKTLEEAGYVEYVRWCERRGP